MKRLVVFDLDGTLAESKSSLDGEMSELIQKLLGLVQVAVISGGDWPQFETQLLSNLPISDMFKRLLLLPTSGTKFYQYENGWKQRYAENFSPGESAKIIKSMDIAVEKSGFKPTQVWGELVEDRGSQITFSALGQQAPVDAKKSWDPDFEKRKQIKALLEPMIPEFNIRMGGATSIDVTRQGIDKAYGIRKLRDMLSIPIEEMIFIGDALFPGGNDYAAIEAGVDSIRTSGPEESKRLIEAIVACLK